MSRTFKINIIFNKDSEIEKLIYAGTVAGENGINDKLRISIHAISLECKRSRDRELSRLLTDFKSTINLQVTKAISFYAAINGYLPIIRKIVITKFDTFGTQKDYYETENIMQPFQSMLPKHLIFTVDELKVLFDGSEKAKVLLVALSFWLKGITGNQPSERFEKLWISFNSLYSFITHKKNETEKLRKMRDFVITNANLFQMSCGMFNSFTKEKIRELQWRNLVLNDHENYNDTKSFFGFIMRYNDYRINQVFKDILCYRKDNLSDHNLLSDTENHINSCISKKESRNEEVLNFLFDKILIFY